jgi:uncharacterized protein YjaG (DUF416 family)
MNSKDLSDPSYQETYRLLPDLAKLREALSLLPTGHQLAFALCCCERLYLSYKDRAESLQMADQLRPILNKLWQHALGRNLTDAEITRQVELCAGIPLGDEDNQANYRDAADAVDGTMAALESCRIYSLDNAVRTAEAVRNKVDRPIWKDLAGSVIGGVGPENLDAIERAIRANPAMQNEMETEAAQLRFLSECEELTEAKISQLLACAKSRS